MSVQERLQRFWYGQPEVQTETAMPPKPGRVRGVVDHVIILDGTMSSLAAGLPAIASEEKLEFAVTA